jgi:hypothetical protein
MMRKFVLAVVALLSLTGTCYAAFAIFQTYRPVIFYNIVTDGGAVCTGYPTVASKTFDINNTTKVLTTTTSTFAPGDVGKYIILPQAGFGAETWTTTIASYTNATNVVLAATFKNVTASTQTIVFGFDAAPNFKTYNTWARANQGTNNQVVLTVPNGSTCWFGSNQTIFTTGDNAYFAGINNQVIEATGAILTGQNGGGFTLAQKGLTETSLTNVSGKSMRLKSASAGASTIELTATSYAAGYISRVSVGDWIVVTGLAIQAQWLSSYGYPPNFQYFDYRQVTSICNNTGSCTGTATITLDRPLAYSYLSTWPEYYDGGAGSMDQGGPATAYVLHSSWGGTVEWRGATIDMNQSYAIGRYVTFRDMMWLGCCGTVPSQNETFTVVNSTAPGATAGWEVDKLVGTVSLNNFTVPRIDFQSSSVDNLIMVNSNVTGNGLIGSPKNATITDTTIAGNFSPGAWTNGVSSGSFVCTRCAVSNFVFEGGVLQQTGTDYSKASGVISFANTSVTGAGPPQRIFAPGGNVYYCIVSGGTCATSIGLYQSGAITQDPTNVYVQSSDAGGFPTYSGYINDFEVHPAPRFTCDACTGDVRLVATNIQRGATPLAPLGQFSSYQNISPTTLGTAGTMKVRGKIVSLTVDIPTAYTGSGTPLFFATGPFWKYSDQTI